MEDRHIIWSNENLDLDDWREDLQEQYPDCSEDELYRIMCETNADYLSDERVNLNIQLSQPILVIADLGLEKVDLNGNGKIDYIMIKGDPENVDAQYRTEFSIKALEDAGFEVNKLDEQVGMWQQEQAQQLVANSLAQYGNDIEVVFCNNDAMALGALQAIQAAGRTVGEDIYLVGVDALTDAVQNIVDGNFTGTVFNDYFSQAQGAANLAVKFLKGEDVDPVNMVDYVKVTSDNAQEILDIAKKMQESDQDSEDIEEREDEQ